MKNVLSNEHFKNIKDLMFSDEFPWFYQDHVVRKDQATAEEKYQIQFVHKFHENSNIVTSFEIWKICFPIFAVLQPHTFLRVKANNVPGRENIITHGMHCDVSVPLSYTAIFYCNTNNGFTEFKDGDKFSSVANSMVVFPSHIKHTGSTCSDEKCRINININFVPSWDNQLLKPIFPQGAETIHELWSKV